MIATAAIALLAAAQAPNDSTLVDAPAANVRVTVDEYREYLHDVIGSARLQEVVLDRLLEAEFAALPTERRDATAVATLADLDVAARRRLQTRIREQFDGDTKRWIEYRTRTGLSEADCLRSEHVLARREAWIRALVLDARRPDRKLLLRLFEQRYGPDGQRAELRQVFIPFEPIRERLRLIGRSDPSRVEELADAEMRRVQERLKELDGDFSRLQPTTISDYRFQRYGVAFADTVRSLDIGNVSAPVRSQRGLHLVQLVRRDVTRFESVREEIEELARTRPVTRSEWQALKDRLLNRPGIRKALAR